MYIDRIAVLNIVSEMLDNPNEHGIYPTSVCYNKLERYIDGVRQHAVKWTHDEDCADLDAGRDPRLKEIPNMINRMDRAIPMI